MKFSILIPTKNRPKNILNVLSTIYKTAKDIKNIETIFYVDNDDEISKQTIDKVGSSNIKYTSSEQKVLFSDMWNQAYKESCGEYLMLCGDDVEFHTKDWDQKILSKFDKYEDKIAYVFPKDGYANGKLGVHGFVHRKWAEIVGFFTPPYFAYWYADTWLDEVSKMIKRAEYAEDVEITHYHWQTGNSRGIDQVYYENHLKINDELRQLYASKKQEREENAKKLLEYINDFKT